MVLHFLLLGGWSNDQERSEAKFGSGQRAISLFISANQDILWGRNSPLLTYRFSEHRELSDLVRRE